MTTAMTGTRDQAGICVNAAGVAVRGAAGPALAAPLNRAIALTVSASDGSPLTGLGAEAFSVSTLTGDRTGARACTVRVRDVSEPMPGVYLVTLDAASADHLLRPFACVVDVRTGGEPPRGGHPAGASRVLVPMNG